MRATTTRLLSEYGMVLILLFLCAYYSIATFADQYPAGASGGTALAREASRQLSAGGRVLVVAGEGQADAEFAQALADEFAIEGYEVAAIVRGQPADARAALQQFMERGERLDGIAASQSAGS